MADKTKPKNKGGRPKKSKTSGTKTVVGYPVGRDNIVVDPEEVRKLAALGCKNIEIANFFGVNKETLSQVFKAEILKGKEEMKISLRRAMLTNAVVNMNATMQIWLSKQYLDMSDNGETDGENNSPLPWVD